MSSRESAMVSKRVRRAVRARAAAGEPHGKLPYGYRFERDPDTGRVLRRVPHEETAPIVREICVRVLAGDALFTVATDLRRRGLLSPRGAQWRPEQVRRIALSPTYAGLRTFKGDVTASATWPALISETDHRALVAKLTDPRRKTWVDGSVKHLLVGLATCGVCDAPCRRIKNRGTPSYACSSGFHVARQQAAVDAFVTETIIARLSQPDALDLFAAEHDPHIAAALEQARDLHARLEGFYEEAAAGRLTPGGLARIESRLLGEIAIAERRARPCLPSAITDLAGPDVAERWAALSVPQRREVVRALMVPVIHKAPREGRRLFNPDLIQIRWTTVR